MTCGAFLYTKSKKVEDDELGGSSSSFALNEKNQETACCLLQLK
jgi:hypothetical protein